MFDVVKKILTSDEYNSIMSKVDLLRMACSDDEELIDAFILSRIFIIKEADNSDKRIKIIETNLVQANNTCLQNGNGRNVLKETIIFHTNALKPNTKSSSTKPCPKK